jgi:hypothetical protein
MQCYTDIVSLMEAHNDIAYTRFLDWFLVFSRDCPHSTELCRVFISTIAGNQNMVHRTANSSVARYVSRSAWLQGSALEEILPLHAVRPEILDKS